MNLAFKKIQERLSFTEIIYLIFFISLICAFRAVTSISIGLLFVTGILQTRPTLRSLFLRHPANEFTLLCILFFLLQLIALFYTHNMRMGWIDLQLKSGLVFSPLAVIWMREQKNDVKERLLWLYSFVLLIATLYLLYRAAVECLRTGTTAPLFYHALVAPFGYHAVYFSILVFVGLAFLLENLLSGETIFDRPLLISLICFLSFFLLLLSSKLILSFYVAYVFYFFIVRARQDKRFRLISYTTILVIMSISAILLATRNPISYRFRDIVHGNITLINQDEFSPSVYFNGIQFRMLQWKLVPEILNEKHSWWRGVTGGDAQFILDQKYLSKHMYAGSPGAAGHGYLGYNTHSQLLESLLQNGIPGLMVFMLINFCLLKIIWQQEKTSARFIILLLFIYSLVESVFQEQYGIVMFTFLPLFIGQGFYKKTTTSSKTQIQSHYQ